MLLELEQVQVFYGAVEALQGISLAVDEGEVVALLGANGAGKSTTLRAITGIAAVHRGSIRLGGQPIHTLAADAIVRRGVVMCPEGRQVFPELTVEENLLVGSYARRDRANVRGDLNRMMERFPRLGERKHQYAGTLSGGEQQMLAIGRALMGKPRILLLDEPSMGLAPRLVREIFQIIAELNREGTTILLVEQNAHMALGVAHRAYVLETGAIALSGPAAELRESRDVQRAYLGA